MTIIQGFTDSLSKFTKSGLPGSIKKFTKKLNKSKFGETGSSGDNSVGSTGDNGSVIDDLSKIFIIFNPLNSLMDYDGYYDEYGEYDEYDNEYIMGYAICIVLQIIIFIGGILSVNYITSKANTEKAHSIRIGLYMYLILSRGNASLLFILLALFKLQIS